jgi:hypothetical protein
LTEKSYYGLSENDTGIETPTAIFEIPGSSPGNTTNHKNQPSF